MGVINLPKLPSLFASTLAPPDAADQITWGSRCQIPIQRGLVWRFGPKQSYLFRRKLYSPAFNGFSTRNTRCPPNEILRAHSALRLNGLLPKELGLGEEENGSGNWTCLCPHHWLIPANAKKRNKQTKTHANYLFSATSIGSFESVGVAAIVPAMGPRKSHQIWSALRRTKMFH